MHAWLIAALVVSWVLVAALAGTLYVLIKQHGNLIMYQQDLDHRLEMASFFAGRDAERELSEVAAETGGGLPVGLDAPDFALSTLDGAEKTIADYKGEPFVIAFYSDSCAYCLDMAPAIGELDDKGRPLVLISHGDEATHKRLAKENKWHSDVLIDPEWDLMVKYQVAGTPSGYLIDSEGRIASPLAVGAGNVLELFTVPPLMAAAHYHAMHNGHADGSEADFESDTEAGSEELAATATAVKPRDVSESTIRRNGLPAGTAAPNFVLQDLDGKTHALADYRGRRVLLMFSDVTCAPCEAMSPDLVKLQEEKGNRLQVIMVSRGDLQKNREKAQAFGYPFPVLTQKSWEVSKLYGMFATPIAFLIDENGVIEKDVAMGPESILQLV